LLNVAAALRSDRDQARDVARQVGLDQHRLTPDQPGAPETSDNPNQPNAGQAARLRRLGRFARWTPPDGDCWFASIIRAARDVANPTPAMAALAKLDPQRLRDLLAQRLDRAGDPLGDQLRTRPGYPQFRRDLVTAGQWTHPMFDDLLRDAARLLDIQIIIVHPGGGQEILESNAAGPPLYLAHTPNHYMPALRQPAPVQGPARTAAPTPGPDGRYSTTDVQQAVATRLDPVSRELSSVVQRLVADPHPLNLTDSLFDPARHGQVLDILEELARGDMMRSSGQDLQRFAREHPGRGVLHEQVPHRVNHTADGRSRLSVYTEAMKAADADALESGATPTDEQRRAVKDYVRRLTGEVLPAINQELQPIIKRVQSETDRPVYYNQQHKDADGLLDKVNRMTRAGRGQYRVGDVVDAVGVRITVPDMASLHRALAAVVDHFRVGDRDRGRILEIDDRYAQPRSRNLAYRVIPLVIGIEVNGRRYTFELQLTTLRASIAADIEHNSLYKSYITVTSEERAAVRRALSEAAAQDQSETAAPPGLQQDAVSGPSNSIQPQAPSNLGGS
jgi:ppGpp synthetase/RelA/SpoT-type nucleotidyltranferase